MKLYSMLAILCGCLAAGQVHGGNILISGNEMNPTIQGYLTSLGHSSTIVSPGSLASTSFAGYTGIWLGWSSTFSTSGTLTANLQAFLNAGGIILAETSLNNTMSFLPDIAGVTTATNHNNTVNIVDPLDPAMAGLTNAGLSNWGQSFHNVFTSTGAFDVLADTPNSPTGAVILSQQVGSGFLILTGQDVSYHIKFGAGATGANSPKGLFLDNVFSLEPANAAVPEPSTFAIFGIFLAVGAGCWFYRRQRAMAASVA